MIIEASNAQAVETCMSLSVALKRDIAWAGGKAANLGEMINAGIPVSDGFVVATSAYRAFMIEHGLDEMAREALTGVDIQDYVELASSASDIRQRIVSKNISPDLASVFEAGASSIEKNRASTTLRLTSPSLFSSWFLPTSQESCSRWTLPATATKY